MEKNNPWLNLFKNKNKDNNYLKIYELKECTFISTKKLATFICKIHGEFERTPNSVLKGIGCSICLKEESIKSDNYYSYNKEKIISIINETNYKDHFNFENFKSDGYHNPTKFLCNVTNQSFEVKKLGRFLKNVKCPYCNLIEKHKSSKDTNLFISQVVNKFNDLDLDFSATMYINNHTNVLIRCIKHDLIIERRPDSILNNSFLCPICAEEKGLYVKTTLQIFNGKLEEFFPNTFDLSKTVFNGINKPCVVHCKLHGEEEISLAIKLFQRRNGCLKCKPRSKVEEDIKQYIQTLIPNLEIVSSKPKWMNRQELDIYLPEYNLAIEYNGTIFHHSSNSSNSFINNMKKDKYYHFNKWKLCFDNNVTLLSVYDFYWQDQVKQNIYKSKIRHYLNLDTKIFARKCKIIQVPNHEAYLFYDQNHIEGSGMNYKEAESYSLEFNNVRYMYFTIGKFYNQSSKSFVYKLHRICTALDYTVIGGLSKCKNFLYNKYGYFKYQLTLSSGGSTLKAFKFKILEPRYFWVNSKNISIYHHRNYCQKHLLEKHFKEPLLDIDTESTYMERLGFLKIYDNGLAEIIHNGEK